MNGSKDKTKFGWKFLAVLGLVKPLKEKKNVEEMREEITPDRESGFAGKLFTEIGIIKPTKDIESQRDVRAQLTDQNLRMGFWAKLYTVLGFVKPQDDERK